MGKIRINYSVPPTGEEATELASYIKCSPLASTINGQKKTATKTARMPGASMLPDLSWDPVEHTVLMPATARLHAPPRIHPVPSSLPVPGPASKRCGVMIAAGAVVCGVIGMLIGVLAL